MKFCTLLLVGLMGWHAQVFADSIRVTDLAAKPPVTRTLIGREAVKLTTAFEDLPWDKTTGKRCHLPAYRIEQLSDESVVLDATICFACNNVRFRKPVQKGLQGFDPSAEAALQLQKILQELFGTPQPR